MTDIIYKEDHLLLKVHYPMPERHKHFAKHLIVCEEPFYCKVKEEAIICRSLLIQSQTYHFVRKAPNAQMVIFFIDELSNLSKWMDEVFFSNEDSKTLPYDMEDKLVKIIEEGSSLEQLDQLVMSFFNISSKINIKYDDRVVFALNYIEASYQLDRSVYQQLAENVCLSKSRFQHLFKEETGIDLRNYLLLKRMEKTYDYVMNRKMNITEAAIYSGFSSASHFSEACKKHYGISLTKFIR